MDKEKESKSFINLGIVLDNKGNILMIRRVKKETGTGGAILHWAFPGGKQRYNETRTECVKREVKDETGYDVNPIREISMRVHPEFPVMIIYHLCGLNSPKPVSKPQESHEIAEIKWISVKEIKNIITSNLDPKVAKELNI